MKRIFEKLNDKNSNTWIGLIQFAKFGIVGVTNTILSYALNVGVLFILMPFDLSFDYLVANVISFVISVLWSFYWNNKYVFNVGNGEKRVLWKTLIKTYISYGFSGIILNNILSWLWITIIGISKFIAPLINLIVSVPLNFFINKWWAFKTEDSDLNEN